MTCTSTGSNIRCCTNDCQLYKLLCIRHGQSQWNETNRFTGWYDSPLTARGREEGLQSARLLKQADCKLDMVFTSVLKRATETVDIIVKELKQNPRVFKSWRLNERHYGELTGFNKAETVKKYGEELVTKWRRSFEVCPPEMQEDHPFYKTIVCDPRYENGPTPEEFPKTESLETMLERIMPFWFEKIGPAIKSGKTVLVCAHGNSIRGIINYLENIPPDKIGELYIPTGIPFYIELDPDLVPIPGGSMQYMGDPDCVERAIQEVKDIMHPPKKKKKSCGIPQQEK